MTGSVKGVAIVQAVYLGDADYLGSWGWAYLTVDPPSSISMTAACDSATVLVGGAVTCTATIGDASATGTVAWTQYGSGIVSLPSSTCSLDSGTCQITVVGSSAGFTNLNATYSGDSNFPSTIGSTGINVNTMSVACNTSSLVVGSSTACKATVVGPAPTGRISWNGLGRFLPPTCKLSEGTCSVRHTPISSGTGFVAAKYLGGRHDSATFELAVTRANAKIVVSCSLRGSLLKGHRATCTATVSGFRPGGTVSWSQSGLGSLTFSQPTCPLNNKPRATVRATCSVTITGVTSGKVSIGVFYGGDVNNTVASDSVEHSVSS